MSNISSKTDNKRLNRLVHEKCNGTLSAEGFVELQELVEKSEELKSEFIDAMAVHLALDLEISGKELYDDAILKHLQESLEQTTLTSTRQAIKSGLNQKSLLLAASVAFLLLSASIFWNSKISSKLDTTIDDKMVIAKLSSLMEGSLWSFGRLGDNNPQDFRAGETIRIKEGRVKMQIHDGAIGILQAPITLQLLAQDRVRLLSGQIKIEVPEGAEGFTVETPCAEVIDLGTVFSVNADEVGTDLVVYSGQVDLKIPSKSPDSIHALETKRFETGQAVRVDKNGTFSRIMNVQSTTNSSIDISDKSQPIILSVFDNIVRDDHWAFYEIVQNGMKEDAQAFVDRFHEWNGLTDSGMPSYLINGDYVKMFNDDKMVEDYRLEVALSKPATIYLLLDNRVSPPNWLLQSFENTGQKIGIDETHHHRPRKENKLGVGPGKSVDFTHSIWKFVATNGGTITLGPNGDSLERNLWHASMYGLVAVPLEANQ